MPYQHGGSDTQPIPPVGIYQPAVAERGSGLLRPRDGINSGTGEHWITYLASRVYDDASRCGKMQATPNQAAPNQASPPAVIHPVTHCQ